MTLVDCDHIGWNSSEIISPLVSLGCIGYIDIAGRRAFTRYGTSNKFGVGKTRYFRAKCVNITCQTALTAAAFHYFKQVVNLSATLFSRQIGAIFGMLSRRSGLSASAGFSRFYWAKPMKDY